MAVLRNTLQIPAGKLLLTKQLDELTTCPVCQEPFKDPRSLPCTHTLCLACISACCNTAISSEKLVCPRCGKYCTRPAGGPSELPKNIYLNQLLDMMTSSGWGSHDVTELVAEPSIDTECDVITRKLQVFTSVTAKHFAGRLFTNIRLNELTSAKTLIENIDVTDRAALMRQLSDDGSSPLFEAVRLGRLDFVEYFLEDCNANIEQRCQWNEPDGGLFNICVATPLWLAATLNRLDIVRCLVTHGAKVNAQSKSLSTVVRSACYIHRNESRIDLIRYLVENGADVNIPNASGYCCIHIASVSAELSRYLIEQGANVNAVGLNGWTALYYAANRGCLNAVKELLSLGADPKIRNEDGVDVLQMSIMDDKDEIADFLLSQKITGDAIRADIFALRGARFVCEQQYKDAVTNWRLAILQSDRNEAFEHKLLIYSRSCQTLDLWNQIEQLPTETDDTSRFLQYQVSLCDDFLGPCHPQTIFSLKYLAAVYADNKIDPWSVDANLDAMHRCRSKSVAHRPKPFSDVLESFCDMTAEFHLKRLSVRFSDIACAFTLTVAEFVETLKQPWCQIDWTSLLTLMKLSILLTALMLEIASENEEENQLLELVTSLVALEPRAFDGRSFLHVALDPLVDSMSTCYPDSLDVSVIETLLECGAAVNCTDNQGNTPLDYILKSSSISLDLTTRLVGQLTQYGSVADT